MDLRHPSPSAALLLCCMLLIAGCTSSVPGKAPAGVDTDTTSAEPVSAPGAGSAGHPASAVKETIAEQLAAVHSTNPVWLEAYRMFRNTRSTEYVHPPYTVDDAAGIYKFDCLGFVDHVLMNADMASYKAIGRGQNPSIESYAAYFGRLDTRSPDAHGWTKVSRPLELLPGDICLWLKPSTLDTGHMWIIAGRPSANPKRAGEVMVRIFDASVAHSDDSRTGAANTTGLGSGIIGYMVDAQDLPTGLYWDGGVSASPGERDSTIICGRLNR